MCHDRFLSSVSLVCTDGVLRLPRVASLWVREPAARTLRALLFRSLSTRQEHHHAPFASLQKAHVTSGHATFHCLLGTHQAQVAQQLSRFTSFVKEMATILSASAIVG